MNYRKSDTPQDVIGKAAANGHDLRIVARGKVLAVSTRKDGTTQVHKGWNNYQSLVAALAVKVDTRQHDAVWAGR